MSKYKKARRFDRAIKPTKNKSYPTRFMFFDTETTQEPNGKGQDKQVLKLGVAKLIIRDKSKNIKKKEICIFRTKSEFYDFLESNLEVKQKLIVYAHNIAFDLMVMDIFNYFYSQGIKLSPPIQSGMRFLWKVKHPLGTIEFINTGNYVPYPLAVIGNDLGFPKLDINFDNTTDEELITYCTRDVEIIEKFIFEFIDFLSDNELGAYKSTIASQALNVYRHRFMREDIVLHSNLFVNTVERDSYLGGRTECFFIGNVPDETIYGLDINSMYPHVMSQGHLPSMYNGTIKEQNPKYIKQIMDSNYVIADCILTTSKPFHGVRWNKNRFKILNSDNEIRGAKLIFPTGTFRTYLHHDELSYAIDNGFITHINNLYLYKPADLFTDYVNFFMEIKIQATENNDKTHRLLVKLFLNSLYGKFGQQYHDMMLVAKNINLNMGVTSVINIDTGVKFTDFEWFNDLWREYVNGEASFSFPAIAGAITARARMLLWQYIERVEIENVYYCDTDSIYTNEIGYLRLMSELHDTKLGAMALEKTLSNLVVNGAKDYIKDGDRVVKGVPKNAQWLNDNVSIATRFEGWKEYRNRGMTSEPLVWEQLKIKSLPYDKGILTDTGRIIPYVIANK